MLLRPSGAALLLLGLLCACSDHDAPRLSVEALALPMAGPATILTVQVDGAEESAAPVRTLLSDRTRLLVEVPAAGPEALVVARDDRGAGALVPADSVRLLVPAPLGEASASTRLFVRATSLVAILVALALGLATWLRGWIAILGLVAAATVPSLLGSSTGLGLRMGALFQGEVPTALRAHEPAVAALLVLAGLALAASGRGRRRES